MNDNVALLLVIVAAGASGLNPCTTGILAALMSTVFGTGRRPKRAVSIGLAYIVALWCVTLAVGFCLLFALTALPLVAMGCVLLMISWLVVAAGLVEIKQFFWYGRGFNLNTGKRFTKWLKKLTRGNVTYTGALRLGAVSGIAALPCTGGLYVATITILKGTIVQSPILLILYTMVFVLPLVGMILVVAFGARVSTLQKWRDAHKPAIRLATGILLVLFGWALLLITNGVLNFE